MKNRGTLPGSRARNGLAREDGEKMAVMALGFLSSEPDRLSRFLDICGLGPHNLRAAAADPGFLAAVLDYLVADEPLLIGFAQSEGLPPERVAAARAAMENPP